jgi:ketosteroid isomerase-like protein
MSQENVDVVRRFVLEDLDEALKYLDPDVVWNPSEERGVKGVDAVRASVARWEATWDEYEVIPVEFLATGDLVVVGLHLRGRGRRSGIESEARVYEVYRLRDGKIVRMDEFSERSEALEAFGLSE